MGMIFIAGNALVEPPVNDHDHGVGERSSFEAVAKEAVWADIENDAEEEEFWSWFGMGYEQRNRDTITVHKDGEVNGDGASSSTGKRNNRK